MTPIVVLGATGSIGRQTLDVAARLEIPVVALAARHLSDDLFDLAARFPDADLIVAEVPARDADRSLQVGPEAIIAAAARPAVTVVNGIVGAAGLRASLAALEASNRLALANKESMVAAGPLMLAAADRHGGMLVPVDSEHSALFQCLIGEDTSQVRRVILTASGGPFREASREQLASVTPQQALKHPTWNMGARITIDSATLFNKGLEVIEAHHLFGLSYDAIDVIVHPQSVVHSLVEFCDGSLKAHLGEPDMRVPIQYALTYPERAPGALEPFDLVGRALTFEAPNRATFRALEVAYAAGRRGGTAPAVLNAADEVAVAAFLGGEIAFLAIADVIEETLDRHSWSEVTALEQVIAADQEAREIAEEVVSR